MRQNELLKQSHRRGRMKKALSFFFSSKYVLPKTCHFRDSTMMQNREGRSVFLAVENDSDLRTLLRKKCFEYFLRDFFPERKQSSWKWNFTAARKSDKDKISYNYYQNRNFHTAKRCQSSS